ncbi:MAG: carboxypeptidase regulatory-like domain-containing protein [Nitrospirae bacterium]|nr:MAG: carboxypeptidase regulatory-like domain-containing protein [Nitrospirota bacterium]
MKPFLFWVSCVIGSLVCFAAMGWSYEEVPVAQGGHITGKVVLKGEKPPPKAFNLITYPEPVYCGRISTGTAWRLLDFFEVDAEGGLKNAVVFLDDVGKGKPFPTPAATIRAQDCTLSPPVMVVKPNQPITVVNMDPILHDVQVYEVAPFGSAVMFHRPLRMNPYHPKNAPGVHEHRPGEPVVDIITFTKGRRVFYLECGFHEFMQTWGLAVTNPYYAITDEHGNFTISDIPEGVYTLVAWHPGLGGILDMKVVVLSEDTLHVRFEFPTPKDRRMAHTTMVDNPHYDPGALETFGQKIEIVPTHERQQTPGPQPHSFP